MLRFLVLTMITSIIFFPEKDFFETPADYHLESEEVALQTEDGVGLHGWYLKAAGAERGVILFLHGNAGNISHRLFKIKNWVENGFSMLMVDYRGYGRSQGTIRHGDDIVRDARAARQWLIDQKNILPERLVLYGESLGTHPAIRLGIEADAAAVVLEAPFTSFVALGKLHYALMPGVEFLLRDFQFDNQAIIGQLKRPLFILHGTRDDVCPHSMGEELFRRAPGPKEFFSIPGGAHSDLPMAAGESYWKKPLEFVLRQIPG